MFLNSFSLDPMGMCGGGYGTFFNPFSPMCNPFGTNGNYFSGFNMFPDFQAWEQSYYTQSLDPINMFYSTQYARLDARIDQLEELANTDGLDPNVKNSYLAELSDRKGYKEYLQSNQNNQNNLKQQPPQIKGKTWDEVGITNPETQKKLEKFGETPESYARRKAGQEQIAANTSGQQLPPAQDPNKGTSTNINL